MMLFALGFGQTLTERVEAPDIPEGAPKPSDVCLRSLVRRPNKPSVPHNTMDAIKGFHATRLEWTYGVDEDYVRDVHALGCTIQGAAANSSIIVDQSDPDWKNQYGCVDLNGQFVIATWMRTWPSKPIYYCVNNPASKAGALAYFKQLIETGCDSVQQDATHLNHSATNWGGCFCRYCMAGFNEWLAEHTTQAERRAAGIDDLANFNYRDHLKAIDAPVGDAFGRWGGGPLKRWFVQFQEDSVTAHHYWWRKELNEWAGRRIAASCNNGTHRFRSPEGAFDYFHGELQERFANPVFLREAFLKARAMGKTQTVMMPQRRKMGGYDSWERHTRQVIATAYALGGHCRVPWDQYMPIPDAGDHNRYFGTPEQYADLYAFVRGCAAYLDGYGDGAVWGADLDDERWAGAIPPVTTSDPHVYAYTRAKPDAPDAPVAIHLVDWTLRKEPFELRIEPSLFFGGRPVRYTLLSPAPYDAAAHKRAWDTKDYAPLVERTPLGAGRIVQVQLPSVEPWGIVLVEPVDAVASGLWQPVVHADEPFFVGRTTLCMASPDPGVEVRYTLDGSAVGRDAEVYKAPLEVTGTCTVRARAFRDSEVSEEASLVVQTADPARNLIENGEFDAGKEGWILAVSENPHGDDAMIFAIDNDAKLEGPNSARLHVAAPDGVAYHMRLFQTVALRANADYRAAFRVMADKPGRLRVTFQEREVPNRVVAVKFVDLTEEPQTVELGGSNRATDEEGAISEAGLHFDCGLLEPGTTVWIDAVSVEEKVTPE